MLESFNPIHWILIGYVLGFSSLAIILTLALNRKPKASLPLESECPDEVEPAAGFDMRQCRPGDRLLTAHGEIVTYTGPSGRILRDEYPHLIRYPDGSEGSRTDDGHVYANKRESEDEDIVGFAPERGIPVEEVKP